MAKLNNRNTVRFSSTLVPQHHDQCMGTRRSAWKSEENLLSPRKRRGRIDRPPKRPSRDQDFLASLPKAFFVGESEGESAADDCNVLQQSHQQTRPTRPPSILKNSKYSTTRTQTILTTTLQDLHTASASRRIASDGGDNSDGEEESPTPLTIKHLDSILDLTQLANRCVPKLKKERSVTSLPSIVKLVDDEDETTSSQRSSVTFEREMVQETDDLSSVGLACGI